MDKFSSFDPSSFDFDPTSLFEELKKLREGQWAVIGPVTTEAGGSPTAKNRFSLRLVAKENPPVNLIDFSPNAQAQPQSTVSVTWEYLCKFGAQEKELESLGNEGWELCTVTSRPNGELWIFKRPRLLKSG